MITPIETSAPGRICLFGEHQDYLHLPVIPCAISLRVGVKGYARDDMTVNLELPDIQSSDSFSLAEEQAYIRERDYNRSAVNLLLRHGIRFRHGADCTVRGDIPINSGTSSSSALMVAWIRFLMELADECPECDPMEVARLAHAAEVTEFREPGGMMDHYSTAMGGVIYLDFFPETTVTALGASLGTFVLGDSGEPKETKTILARVKEPVLEIVDHLVKWYKAFSLRETRVEELYRYSQHLSSAQMELLKGTVVNHALTREAKLVLEADTTDHRRIGELLNQHHHILRDILHISTPKIDRMLEAALGAGAFGGKINGSGGGGCMFAYAPDKPEKVAEAIEKAGGKAYIIQPGEGVTVR
ncbi:GHMP kinase [bacterium]|nr:GHMP kinase [bacterium]